MHVRSGSPPKTVEQFAPGEALGHYRILEKIGEGGMGEVYRARDDHLGRDVAVKVLPAGTLADEHARRRFRKEAEALAKLEHPNIATIHDFDTQGDVDFLVMEYIPGETLSSKLRQGPLPEKEVVRLGLQLAEGLAAAHEHGVIHCDLKPGNLRLTSDGRLKILDFGLAKLARCVGPTAITESAPETVMFAGTLPCMAPEQLKGEKVDARSDIWAAGVVLYEIATGRLPFTGKTSTAVADQILHAEAPPPQKWQPRCSQRLADIILKCLEKDAENRYQSAKELQVDLRRLTSPRSAASAGVVVHKRIRSKRIRSLAVLPLANFSHDPEQEYFADGMTEALICDLAKLRALKITSRTSVMHYKGSETPLPQIAAELNVDAVVEGSVMRVGSRVRITAQLIHAASDTHLWAESYEQDFEDVLLVQGEIARAIAREIQVAATPDEAGRLGRARRVNPDAYEAYLKGRFHWYKLSREHLDSAFKYFQVSLERDPRDPLAYAGIAAVWEARGDCGVVPPLEAFPKAKAAALKAIELDESLSEAHINLGNVRCSEWSWNEAEREYQRAIELTPNSAEAHFFLSDLLISQRRFDEWKVHIERALELDPCNSFLQCFFGWHLFYLNRCDEAIAELRKTLQLEPNFPAVHLRLWSAFHSKLMDEDAARAAKNFFAALGDEETVQALQRGYTSAGCSGAMRLAAETLSERSELNYVPPTQIARLYAHAGDKNNSLKWLERAYEERLPAMMHLTVDLDWSLLRGEPGFQDLVRRMNL
ncbi:MAG TPA: protein kinase [Terriglobales bacterium]|nr:protein kinase [Terriglobales bacterium]